MERRGNYFRVFRVFRGSTLRLRVSAVRFFDTSSDLRPPSPHRMRRRELRRRLRGFEIASPLRHALEEFVALTQATDADVFVLQHRFDDAENRFRAEVVAVIEAFDAFEDFFLAQARIFEGALLEAISFDQI